ncbi:hypothetical protein O9929_19655 [Vibrio lentus]|nr:hypothetical protein [Vibrio lentus]
MKLGVMEPPIVAQSIDLVREQLAFMGASQIRRSWPVAVHHRR